MKCTCVCGRHAIDIQIVLLYHMFNCTGSVLKILSKKEDGFASRSQTKEAYKVFITGMLSSSVHYTTTRDPEVVVLIKSLLA